MLPTFPSLQKRRKKNRVMICLVAARLVLPLLLAVSCSCFLTSSPAAVSSTLWQQRSRGILMAMEGGNEEADRLRRKADELREEIRKMEESIGETTRARRREQVPTQTLLDDQDEGMSLKNKRVLVVGANGRLGSMVCRYLLRSNPQTEVVAAVHYVGENSPTSRGYGRLSYEVGAEDGVGLLGPAWSSEERTATFEFAPEMRDYNLQNLRVVEVELLDPVQCQTITEGVDSVIWCATDFNGNRPRAISGLNVAFLFRAVTYPTKGRVEIEGLRNILGGLKSNKSSGASFEALMGKTSPRTGKNDPINVVLVSTAPKAFDDFETPFGTFNGLKREGEELLRDEFPSLTHSILQMTRYDDNFVDEGLDVQIEERDDDGEDEAVERRRINRRDAARAVVNALVDDNLKDKTVQVWTATR